MHTHEAVQWAWDELEPELVARGYELVESEIAQQSGAWVLRLYIDKPGGISLDDCQTVSHVVRPLMDNHGSGTANLMLEVSSPGFDRPVRKAQDFERFMGERVKIKTHRPVDGRRRFTGLLKSIRDGLVTVDCDGALYDIAMDNLHKANLDR